MWNPFRIFTRNKPPESTVVWFGQTMALVVKPETREEINRRYNEAYLAGEYGALGTEPETDQLFFLVAKCSDLLHPDTIAILKRQLLIECQ